MHDENVGAVHTVCMYVSIAVGLSCISHMSTMLVPAQTRHMHITAQWEGLHGSSGRGNPVLIIVTAEITQASRAPAAMYENHL